MFYRSILFASFILYGIFMFSCNKEEFGTNPDIQLVFSTDTVSFDTVFTSIGSTTQLFKVKNQGRNDVNISRIFLAGGLNSPFRLNINGKNTHDDSDVRISAKDSLFIFVEVTVDPTGQNNPMVMQDSIVFNLNGNFQDVDLIAFGQDFHLFDGEILKSQRWQNDKPYLIYNSVLVDSLETLVIDPGCRIHFHKGSSLFVKGTLNAKGTFEEPVKFLGDRLEEVYENVPGQWGASAILDNGYIYVYGGLHFLIGSFDNTMNYAIVKNAGKGIQIDSMGFSENPVLTIRNSRIENMTLNCLDARTTYLEVSNCIFANSGSYAVALRYGGDYSFFHCTVANYFNSTIRKEPSLVLNNYYEFDKKTYSFDFSATFVNCIIYGSNSNEIVYDSAGSGLFEYEYKNCLLKTNPNSGAAGAYVQSVFNQEPRFTLISENIFSIDSLSPARNIGDPEIAGLFPFDLNNNSRLEDEGPDLGALEWVTEEEEAP
jgi:hypothetical protein